MSNFPIAAAGTIALALLQAQLRRATKALLDRLPAEDGAELIKGAIHGTHAGTEYRVRAVDLNTALVSIVCADVGRVRLSKRRLLDRWGAGLFPHDSFATGDPRFDEDVLVQTRDPEVARHWLADRKVRQLATSFRPGGCSVVHLDGIRLKVSVRLNELKGADAAATLHATVEKLVRMTEPLRAERRQSFPPPAPKHDDELKASWWICGGLFALSGSSLIVSAARLGEHEPIWGTRTSLLLGLAAGTAVVALGSILLTKLLARRSAPWRLLWVQLLILVVTGAFLVPGLGRLGAWLLAAGGSA